MDSFIHSLTHSLIVLVIHSSNEIFSRCLLHSGTELGAWVQQ